MIFNTRAEDDDHVPSANDARDRRFRQLSEHDLLLMILAGVHQLLKEIAQMADDQNAALDNAVERITASVAAEIKRVVDDLTTLKAELVALPQHSQSVANSITKLNTLADQLDGVDAAATARGTAPATPVTTALATPAAEGSTSATAGV